MESEICTYCSKFATCFTIFAALSQGVGGVIAVSFKSSNVGTYHMLCFSAGVMLYLSFLEILSDAINIIGFNYANLHFFLGMFFFLSIECILDKSNDELSMIAFTTLFSMSLHNIPEGIAVYITCLKGTKAGLPLAIAMALHNIPEGMAVASPILACTNSKFKAILFATISGLFEVLGMIIVRFIFEDISRDFMEAALCSVAGMMVGLCLFELIPNCIKNLTEIQFNVTLLLGMIFMFSCQFLASYYTDL